MQTTGHRPRELNWYHAGPMLFGDWGTSRLYVLGLAFAFNGRAAFWFIAAMGVLLVAVGWCYTIICRLFPDGGGVYSSARHRSQLLAVIGALLLCADYVVTASLSCLDAFHYIGIKETRILNVVGLDALLAAAMILIIGALNYFGPRKTGTIAMFIALATVVLTLVIAVFCMPHLGSAQLAPPRGGWTKAWIGFTEIVLALSGVEAIANMTGIMVRPVEKTARKSIVPVMIEIVVLNLVLAAAMDTLPDSTLYQTTPAGAIVLNAAGEPIPAHTADMLKVIAARYVGPAFAAASALVFAALLLSAVNTALGDLVSIQYMLSRDRELPRAFSGLNRYGMPLLPLVLAGIVPAVVLLLFPTVEALADLYAVGVVGAIAINMGSTSTDPNLPMRPWERLLMFTLTIILAAIEVTIVVNKPHARDFALVILILGLAGRMATLVLNKGVRIEPRVRRSYVLFSIFSIVVALGLAFFMPGQWLGSLLSTALAVAVALASRRAQTYRTALIEAERAGAPLPPRQLFPGVYSPKEHVMVATQGSPRLIEFALKEAKSRQAELQLLFVRHYAVVPMGTQPITSYGEDEQALKLFEEVRERARKEGIPLRTLYCAAYEVPEAILEMAVTHGADLLLLGTSRRGTLWRAMKGDVIQGVAEHLPENVGLLIHA